MAVALATSSQKACSHTLAAAAMPPRCTMMRTRHLSTSQLTESLGISWSAFAVGSAFGSTLRGMRGSYTPSQRTDLHENGHKDLTYQ